MGQVNKGQRTGSDGESGQLESRGDAMLVLATDGSLASQDRRVWMVLKKKVNIWLMINETHA